MSDINSLSGEQIEFFSSDNANGTFESEWCALFAQCYDASESKARAVFRKYRLNPARFAILRVDSRLVACYSGVRLESALGPVFLATDTMSDGTRKKASVLLGTALYKRLSKEGVVAVVGYPNENIRRLREKHLSWVLTGVLYLYVGIPFLWRIGFGGSRAKKAGLWRLRRPSSGAFATLPPFVRLVARGRAYKSGFGLPITLSAALPGPFFVRVPSWIVAPRQFGYRILGDAALDARMRKIANALDLDTIDVP